MNKPLLFTGGMAQTNAWLLDLPGGRVLIDAPEGAANWLRGLAVKPTLLVLTHQHYDHVMDAAAVAAWAGCPVWAHSPAEPELSLAPMLQAAGYDLVVPAFTVNRTLAGDDHADLAGTRAGLRYVPGHARDSLVIVLPDAGWAFVGDTLFAGGVGRTDLPGGSWPLLLTGIRQHLLTLPAETIIFPGHGETTTIAREAATNPFLNE